MKFGLTLTEESYCQLIAHGKTPREAYSEAYSFAITDERRGRIIDKRTSRLMKRADIAARIVEAAGEAKRKNREMWERRGEDLADRIYTRVMEADKDGLLLSKGALKGIEVLAKLKGLNAPEETVLKDGGKADDYVPRGVEGMSAEDLRAIIDQEERTIDIVEGTGGRPPEPRDKEGRLVMAAPNPAQGVEGQQ